MSAIDYRQATWHVARATLGRATRSRRELADAQAQWRALQRLGEIAVGYDDAAEDALRLLERGTRLGAARGARRLRGGLGLFARGRALAARRSCRRRGAVDRERRSFRVARRLLGANPLAPEHRRDAFRDPAGQPGLRIVFEETLQPFVEISCDDRDRLRARQSGHDRPCSRRARTGARAARRGGRALRAGRRRARAGRRARAPGLPRARRGSPQRGARVPRARAAAASRHARPARRRDGVVGGSASWRPSAATTSRAEQPLSEARELFRRAGDRWGLVSALWRTADLAIARERLDEADAALQEARAVVGETERQGWIAVTVATLAEVAQLRGDAERARALFEQARDHYLAAAHRPASRRWRRVCKGSPRIGKGHAKSRRVGLPVQRQPNGGSHEYNNRPGPRGGNGAGAAGGNPRARPARRRRGLRRGVPDLERRVRRSPSGGDRPLQWRGRCDRRGRVRAQQRPRDRGSRRRPQHRRVLELRRRAS